MTLNGEMALILRYITELGSFLGYCVFRVFRGFFPPRIWCGTVNQRLLYVVRRWKRTVVHACRAAGLPLLITPPSGDDLDAKRCPVRLPEEDMSRLVTWPPVAAANSTIDCHSLSNGDERWEVQLLSQRNRATTRAIYTVASRSVPLYYWLA